MAKILDSRFEINKFEFQFFLLRSFSEPLRKGWASYPSNYELNNTSTVLLQETLLH